MEDVLDVYEMPYNPDIPVVCMDEKPYQLLGEARDSWAMRPGDNKKVDSEYVREGTCSIFTFIEPLGGKHHVSVREHRTAVDWAEEIKYLVDVMYPAAEKIILVMDNLNTHKPSSLYKKYPPEEARRIIKKLEIHYTPKRQLAGYCRDRTKCNDKAVPEPENREHRKADIRAYGMGEGKK